MSPQTFHVLRCVACKQFQNHIVKKSSNKWNCKVCNTKQSLQQVFGEGSAADCRIIVQKLNFACGEAEEEVKLRKALAFQLAESEEPEFDEYLEHRSDFVEEESQVNSLQSNEQPVFCGNLKLVPKNRSKWTKYSDEDDFRNSN